MSPTGQTLGAAGAAAAAALLGGCIASNVVAPAERMVAPALEDLAFAPAPDLQLDGLYESVDIRGEAAVALRRIYYGFSPDGTYTAAALAEVDGRYAFQTLSGTWRNDPDGFVLDDGDPVALERAGDHVRLSAPSGVVVLVRRELP